MKKIILSLTAIVIATISIVSCKNESTNSSTSKDSLSVVQQPKLDTTLKKEVDSSKQTEIVCKETEEKIDGQSSIINTCTWTNYKSVATGSDYKGKTFWSYEIYKLINGSYAKIKNSQLFNDKKGQLLSIINKKIKTHFIELSKDPENKVCFSGVEKAPEFTFDNLDVFLDKGGFAFSYSFGLPTVCVAVDGDVISFKLNEIEPYLKK